MNITITLEEYQTIRRLLDFADWYLDDHYPSSEFYQEQYEEDREDVIRAQEVIEQIDANIDAQYTTPTFEPTEEI